MKTIDILEVAQNEGRTKFLDKQSAYQAAQAAAQVAKDQRDAWFRGVLEQELGAAHAAQLNLDYPDVDEDMTLFVSWKLGPYQGTFTLQRIVYKNAKGPEDPYSLDGLVWVVRAGRDGDENHSSPTLPIGGLLDGLVKVLTDMAYSRMLREAQNAKRDQKREQAWLAREADRLGAQDLLDRARLEAGEPFAWPDGFTLTLYRWTWSIVPSYGDDQGETTSVWSAQDKLGPGGKLVGCGWDTKSHEYLLNDWNLPYAEVIRVSSFDELQGLGMTPALVRSRSVMVAGVHQEFFDGYGWTHVLDPHRSFCLDLDPEPSELVQGWIRDQIER